jgi:hypothetical protein
LISVRTRLAEGRGIWEFRNSRRQA